MSTAIERADEQWESTDPQELLMFAQPYSELYDSERQTQRAAIAECLQFLGDSRLQVAMIEPIGGNS